MRSASLINKLTLIQIRKNSLSIKNSSISRNSSEISYRISCLHLFLSRWGLEAAKKNGIDNSRIISSFNSINKCLNDFDLKTFLIHKEKHLMELPLGSWSQNDINESYSNWESYGTLIWVLNFIKMPNFYTFFDKSQIFQSTCIKPAEPNSLKNFIEKEYSLKDLNCFQDQFVKAETWFWRTKAHSMLQLQKNKFSTLFSNELNVNEVESNISNELQKIIKKLPKAIKKAAILAKEKGIIDNVSENDFGVYNKASFIPFSKLDDDIVDDIKLISSSRLLSFYWISGAIEWDTNIQDIDSGHSLISLWDVD